MKIYLNRGRRNRKMDKALYKKLFGTDLNTADSVPAPEVIPVGISAFDKFLVPIGGIPRGMITEFKGLPSTWKSGAAYHLIANCQKSGLGTPVLFDAENAFNSWATYAGVDPANLIYPEYGSSWKTAEDCYKQIAFFIGQRVPLIVVDSLTTLVTKDVLENLDTNKESRLGSLPRVTNEWMKRWIAGAQFSKDISPIPLKDSGTAIVVISHVYTKFGVWDKAPEHSKYESGGGKGLKFLSHLSIFFHTVGIQKEKGQGAVRQKLRAIATKTRFSEPLRSIDFSVDFNNTAYDDIELLIAIGKDSGLITSSGAWYTVGKERFNGKESLQLYLESHPDIKDKLFSTGIAYDINKDAIEEELEELEDISDAEENPFE